MQLFVAKNGQQLGPFDEAQVRGMLAGGNVSGEDLAWHADLPGWQPLATVLGVSAPPPPPVAAPLPPAAAPYAPSMILPPPGSAPAFGVPSTMGVSALATGNLASAGARLGAVLLDILLFFVAYLPGIILAAMSGGRNGGDGPGALATIGISLSGLLALALIVVQIVGISTRGQTIGKRIVGVRIVRTNGAPAGFVNGFLLRSFVGALPSGIPFVGIIYAIVDACFIFREDRRCIHDLIGDTCVVRA